MPTSGTPNLGTCNENMSLTKHLAMKIKEDRMRRPKGLYRTEILLLKGLHADSIQGSARK